MLNSSCEYLHDLRIQYKEIMSEPIVTPDLQMMLQVPQSIDNSEQQRDIEITPQQNNKL